MCVCIPLFPCSIYTPFDENDTSSGGETFLFALLNALIVVAIVIVMTVVLVCLFKYRCYRVGSCRLHCIHTCVASYIMPLAMR